MRKLILFAIVGLMPACDLACGAEIDAKRTIAREFYPSALLKKYEWFKDAAATLDARRASLEVYSKRKAALASSYDGAPRSKWAREDREQMNLWETEEAGLRSSYNKLAAEYNAQMAKFNWRFTNAGDVPPGGQPLPREFRTYDEGI